MLRLCRVLLALAASPPVLAVPAAVVAVRDVVYGDAGGETLDDGRLRLSPFNLMVPTLPSP